MNIHDKKRLRENGNESQIEAAAIIVRDNVESLAHGAKFEIKRSSLIHDFSGNEFVLAELSPSGYGIYNVSNGDVVEAGPAEASPFSGEEGELLYVPWVGYYKSVGEAVFDLSTGDELSDEQIQSLRTESERYVNAAQETVDAENTEKVEYGAAEQNLKAAKRAVDGDNPIWNGIVTADTEVPYSWYFKKCTTQFPVNSNGFCGYVAGSMLLSYNEIFASTGYFSASEAKAYLRPYSGSWSGSWDSTSFAEGPIGVPELIDTFPQAIWGDGIGGSVPNDIANAVNSFMSGKNKTYGLYNYVSMFSNIYDPIKDGVPAAYFGNISTLNAGSHAVVAYGKFDDGRLLCHFGWEFNTQVVMSKLGLFAEGGVLAIYNKSAHVHNRYFVNNSNGHKYCGCGAMVEC